MVGMCQGPQGFQRGRYFHSSASLSLNFSTCKEALGEGAASLAP
jgi:hypothetical protein